MNEYETLMGLIRARRSIRRFSARAVGRDDILRLVEAARWAPSNHNRQPWRFIVVEEKQADRATGREGRHETVGKTEVPAPDRFQLRRRFFQLRDILLASAGAPGGLA